jgi:phospholipid/cholesterol/gamma-HCH transport system ATP-binding protein
MQGSPEQFVFRVSDLVVGFRQQNVIDHLSLDVRRGEILGLVGASGGGKSVLMRTIIRLIPIRSGHIQVMGIDIDNSRGRDVHTAAMWGILSSKAHCFRH